MDPLTRRLRLARKALASLREVLRQEPSDFIRDSAIKRFEYTFETTWKAGQLYLRQYQNVEPTSPKTVFREAGPAGLLTEAQVEKAFEMANDRNLTVHTYNENLAKEICQRLPAHADLLEHMIQGMEGSAQRLF